MLNPTQHDRIRNNLRSLKHAPEWRVVRQFITAEGAQDEPDYTALRRAILDTLGAMLDEEITAAKEVRGRSNP